MKESKPIRFALKAAITKGEAAAPEFPRRLGSV